MHIFPYAFDKIYNSLLDESGEKPSQDAVILFIDTEIYVNGEKKTDHPSGEDVNNFHREILIMKLAGHHQNIVSIIGYCTINVAKPMLVVEYCNQGDLQTYLRTVSLK